MVGASVCPSGCRCWKPCATTTGRPSPRARRCPRPSASSSGATVSIPDWTPSGTGDGDAWQLPANLQDFAELKTDMTFVTGLDMMDAQFKGHGWGVCTCSRAATATCARRRPTSRGRDGRITRNVQRRRSASPRLIRSSRTPSTRTSRSSRSRRACCLRGHQHGHGEPNLAHRGPNYFAARARSAKLFNNLFGMGVPIGAADRTSPAQLARSVLDAVLEDANRLKDDRRDRGRPAHRCAHGEHPCPRAAHPRRAAGPTAQPAASPTPPTATAGRHGPADMTAKSQAMNRLIAAAVACNLTRVYTHLWSGARDDNTLPDDPPQQGSPRPDARRQRKRVTTTPRSRATS